LVRSPSDDGSIITVGWYTDLALIVPVLLPDGRPTPRRWFIADDGWYARPTVVNVITTDVQPAVMKVTYHYRLLPTGAKTIGEGGLELAMINFL